MVLLNITQINLCIMSFSISKHALCCGWLQGFPQPSKVPIHQAGQNSCPCMSDVARNSPLWRHMADLQLLQSTPLWSGCVDIKKFRHSAHFYDISKQGKQFGEPVWWTSLMNQFGEPVWWTSLMNQFGEPVWWTSLMNQFVRKFLYEAADVTGMWTL